jgi:hypothetical protein
MQEILRKWSELRGLAISAAIAEHLKSVTKKMMTKLGVLRETDRRSLEQAVSAAIAEAWNEVMVEAVQDE